MENFQFINSSEMFVFLNEHIQKGGIRLSAVN